MSSPIRSLIRLRDWRSVSNRMNSTPHENRLKEGPLHTYPLHDLITHAAPLWLVQQCVESFKEAVRAADGEHHLPVDIAINNSYTPGDVREYLMNISQEEERANQAKFGKARSHNHSNNSSNGSSDNSVRAKIPRVKSADYYLNVSEYQRDRQENESFRGSPLLLSGERRMNKIDWNL